MNRYDAAQTNALQLLRRQLERAALDIEQALAQQGNPDQVLDAIVKAQGALQEARRINHDISIDAVLQYAPDKAVTP